MRRPSRYIRALPSDDAAMAPREAENGREQGGLAYAVASEQCNALAFGDAQRHVLDHDGFTVAGAEAFQAEHVSHGVRVPGTPPARARRQQSRRACPP